MEILNRVKFDGPTDNAPWIVYKVPQESIILGSQLIVGQGQEALFVKGGKVQDLFGPGTYTLSSGNLPFLTKLIKYPFGGKTPLTAEIIYVNKTINMGLKWGSSSPVNVEDPKYGLLLSLRAFGQYGIKIVDSRLFINSLVGVMQLQSGYNQNFVDKQFISMINTKFKSNLMAFLRKEHISFLDLAEYYDAISEQTKNMIENSFFEYGIEITSFYVESIKPPKEEYEKLRQYKEELALGDKFYTKRRSFDVMEGIAQSPTGGMIGTGVGFGAGIYATPTVMAPIEQVASSIKINENISSDGEVLKCIGCNRTINKDSAFCPYCGHKAHLVRRCTSCGVEVDIDAKFCSRCGAALEDRICSKCSNKLEQHAKFCSKCGTRC